MLSTHPSGRIGSMLFARNLIMISKDFNCSIVVLQYMYCNMVHQQCLQTYNSTHNPGILSLDDTKKETLCQDFFLQNTTPAPMTRQYLTHSYSLCVRSNNLFFFVHSSSFLIYTEVDNRCTS